MTRPRWLLLALPILLALAAYIALDQPLPAGAVGPAADALAHQLQSAAAVDAWRRTGAVRWTFAQRRHLWDRRRGLARVQWDDTEVQLDLWHNTGLVRRGGDEADDDLVAKAHSYWINDSFWLNPLAKLFDPGVERRLVTRPDGGRALLVTYTAGGDTPGDAYLWILGPDGLPRAWKMWVSIIPLGGVEASWEEWVELATGAKISLRHRLLFFDLELRDVAGAGTLAALVDGPDPLAAIAAGRD